MNRGVGIVNRGIGSVNRGIGSVNRGIGSVNHGVGMNRGVGIVNRGIGSVNRGVGITQGFGVRTFPRYISTSGKKTKENGKKDESGKEGRMEGGGRMDGGSGRMDGGSGRMDSREGRVDFSSGRTESLGSETMNKFSGEKLDGFSQDKIDRLGDFLSSEKMKNFSDKEMENLKSGGLGNIGDLNLGASSGKIDSASNGRMERWINYIQEKRPEVYSFGQRLSEKSVSLRNSVTSASVDKTANDKKPEDWNDILNRWYQQYQDFVGITDLKKAQDRVTELSETLLETQGRRRALQAETEDLQERLVNNHQRITKTEQYSQEHFTLFDQAREMNDRLKVVRAEFLQCERTERDTFTQLSAAIRDCHERERMQAEQSKYWSIIASVVSAALASIITSVNNWVRIREIKDHVTTNNKSLLDGYRQMHQDVMQVVKSSEAFNEAGKVVKGAETAQVASALGEGDPGRDGAKGVLESALGVSQVTPGHPTVTLAPGDISQISKELLREISEALANDRDKLRELLMENIGKVGKVEKAGRGELTREATEDNIFDLQAQDVKEIKTGTISDTEKPPPTHDLTLETAQALGSAIALDSAIPGSSEREKPTSEYTYRHIASAMAVGAGIGTLATACIMKSLGGG